VTASKAKKEDDDKASDSSSVEEKKAEVDGSSVEDTAKSS
jgi:hypothetical protein